MLARVLSVAELLWWAAAALAGWVLYRTYLSHRRRSPFPSKVTADGVPVIEPKGRRAGHWQPVDFTYPAVSPADYNVMTQLPHPYRPFRYGTVIPTMGLLSMPWDEWIQLDQEYLKYTAIRQKRTDEQGADLVFTLPGAEEGARECALELSSFLAKRYPQIFKVHPLGSQHSPGGAAIQEIECLLRGTKWRLQRSLGGSEPCNDAMTVCGLLIPDDTFLMMEKEDGHHYLVGGSACTPGFWRLKDKLGMRLRDVHISSDVPHWKSRLETPMERFFSRLPVDKPVQRNNYCGWGPPSPGVFVDGASVFQMDDVLPWNTKMMGDETHFVHKIHAPDPVAVESGQVKYTPPTPIKDPAELWLRSERQTLRRMPRTGIVLFTSRTYLTHFPQLLTEPRVPGRMLSAINGMDSTISKYKATELFRDTIIPVLEQSHADQVKSGVVAQGDQTQTYPF